MAQGSGYGSGQNSSTVGGFSALASELERGALNLGLMVGAARSFGDAVGNFAELERQLTLANSVAGGTLDTFKAMEKQVRQLSTVTTVSATQGAAALYYLASAGFSAEEAMQALQGTVLLSIATQHNLAETSDILAAAITSFGLHASDASDVANLLAASAAHSQATVEKLGFSLRQVGPFAHLAGISIGETVTQLSLLFNVGLRGEQAGTALRNVIARLVDPTAAAVKALKELNVQITDQHGNLLPLEQIFKQLADSNNKAGASTTDLAIVFGLRALSGAAALEQAAKQGGKAWDEMRAKVENTQTAFEQAAAQMGTLSGRAQVLKNLFTELANTFGEAVSPALKDFLDAGTWFLRLLISLSPQTKGLIIDLLGLTAGLVAVTKVSGLFLGLAERIAATNISTSVASWTGRFKELFTTINNGLPIINRGQNAIEAWQLMRANGGQAIPRPNGQGDYLPHQMVGASYAISQGLAQTTAQRVGGIISKVAGAAIGGIGGAIVVGTLFTAGYELIKEFTTSQAQKTANDVITALQTQFALAERLANTADGMGEGFAKMRSSVDSAYKQMMATENKIINLQTISNSEVPKFFSGLKAAGGFAGYTETGFGGVPIPVDVTPDALLKQLGSGNQDAVTQAITTFKKVLDANSATVAAHPDLQRQSEQLLKDLQGLETAVVTYGAASKEANKELDKLRQDTREATPQTTQGIIDQELNAGPIAIFLDALSGALKKDQDQVAIANARLRAQLTNSVSDRQTADSLALVDEYKKTLNEKQAKMIKAFDTAAKDKKTLPLGPGGVAKNFGKILAGTFTFAGPDGRITALGDLGDILGKQGSEGVQQALTTMEAQLRENASKYPESSGIPKAIEAFINQVIEPLFGDGKNGLLTGLKLGQENIDKKSAEAAERVNTLRGSIQHANDSVGKQIAKALTDIHPYDVDLQKQAALSTVDTAVSSYTKQMDKLLAQAAKDNMDPAEIAKLRALATKNAKDFKAVLLDQTSTDLRLKDDADTVKLTQAARDLMQKTNSTIASAALNRGSGSGIDAYIAAAREQTLNPIQAEIDNTQRQLDEMQAKRPQNLTSPVGQAFLAQEKQTKDLHDALLSLYQAEAAGLDTVGAKKRLDIAYSNQMLDIVEQQKGKTEDFFAGFRNAIDRANVNQTYLFEFGEQLYTKMLDDMSSGFADQVVDMQGTWRDAIASMLKDWAKFALTVASRQAFNGIFSSIFGGGNIVINAADQSALDTSVGLGAITPNAYGNAFDYGKVVQAFATGGVYNDPTYFRMANGGMGVMAEAGQPEAAMPLKRLANGKLGVYVDGSAGTTLHYSSSMTINLPGGASSGGGGGITKDTMGALGQAIDERTRAVVAEVITREQRPGGMLNRGGVR